MKTALTKNYPAADCRPQSLGMCRQNIEQTPYFCQNDRLQNQHYEITSISNPRCQFNCKLRVRLVMDFVKSERIVT